MVIVGSGLATIQRTVALLVIRVAILVPVFAQTLVATVLHRPHGVFLRLVDIQHLATILSLVDVEHLTAADSTSAMRVVRVANLLHLQHVLTADALVATLIEQDAGIVAVVDDGITHQLRALRPARPLHILLGITSRHSLRQSHTVARLDVLLPRGDVHPAHHVAPRLNHQAVRVVAKPGRYRQANARPFVRRSLGIAVHHHHTVVEPYLALAEAGLAETRTDVHVVDGRTIDHQTGPDGIEIAIAPRPEMQAGE